MPTEDIRPATPGEIMDTLAYALCFDGRKRTHDGDRLMARIVAERLTSHLARSGFLLMKTPPYRSTEPARSDAPITPDR